MTEANTNIDDAAAAEAAAAAAAAASAAGDDKGGDKGAAANDDAGKAQAAADAAKSAGEAATEFVADSTKTDEENAAALADWEKTNGKGDKGKESAGLPDDWREQASKGDEDLLKELKRYGSLSGVAKALAEAKKALRSGKVQMDKPDASDEKGMAEWRKAQGIPDDPTGYKLPDEITKRLTDADKPVLSNFTEYAHSKGARPDVVEIASAWYVDQQEAAAEDRLNKDTAASEAAEDALRKDWAHGEFKANTVLGKRYMESIPGVGDSFTEARLPDGRRFGDIPEFVAWAADQGRNRFGDLAFSTSDGETKHNMRKEEIEKIRDTDFARYESEGLDKEMVALTAKELARGKR